MPVLMAMGASLVLRRGKRTRELPLDEFYLAYQKTALEPGEFVERTRVPRGAPNALLRTYKISKRFDQDIAAVCGAFRLVLDRGRIADARIAYGGMAATPKRAVAAERALAGREWNEAAAQAAMDALGGDYAPITDMRASGAYRRRVARNLLYRFWVETSGRKAATRVAECVA
jgi:xanthine dehydrogenase small subunit